MALDREKIYSALLGVIQTATPWATPVTRRLRDVSELGVGEQPTASLIDTEDESGEQQRGLPQKWTLRSTLFVYARTDVATVGPTQILNPLILAVETALQFQNSQGGPAWQGAPGKLGLLNIFHLRIKRVEKVSGTDSGQGVAMIDIEISAAAV